MKIREKYLWLGAILIMGSVIHQQYTANNNLSFLLKTHEVESQIQNSQLLDLYSQISTVQAEEYNKGFEQGKTQAAITLMNGDSLVNYTDGYHAATEQLAGSDIREAELLLESLDKALAVEEDYIDIIDLLTEIE